MLIADWYAQGKEAASASLARLRGWIDSDPERARTAAAEFDAALYALRCQIRAIQATSKKLPPGPAKDAIHAELRPLLEAYYRHAAATYGSVEALSAHFDAVAPPCAGVGLAPLLALPAAAWYAGGAVLATGAVAYAAASVSGAWSDVRRAEAANARAAALAECIARGGSESACLTASAPPVDPGGWGDQTATAASGIAGLLVVAGALGAAYFVATRGRS